MPSPKAVQEFRELFLKRYGVVLSDAEALEQSGRLLRLYMTVFGLDETVPLGGDDEKNLH